VSAPKQPIGLTNFYGSITSCPPNPDAIRSIVFTKCDNLAVTNGAATEIQIPLGSFYVPVSEAARLSFTLPGKTSTVTDIHKLNLGGVDTNGDVKFIALMPDYGKGATSNSTFLEWTSIRSIDSGELSSIPQVGPNGNTSFNFSQINGLEFQWGKYLDYDNVGNGSLFAATNGGLLEWNGLSCKLWNTLNSNCPTDYISDIKIDSSNVAWLSTNLGVVTFINGVFDAKYNVSNSGLPSNNVLDIEVFGDKLVVGTDKGLSVLDKSGQNFSTYTIYNTPLLKHNVIKKVSIAGDPIIFAGTTGGAYFMDSNSKTWGKYPLNSVTVPGWEGSDDIQDIAVYLDSVYFATNSGLVVVPYTGLTGSPMQYTGSPVSTITGGVGGDGPFSNNFYSLRVENNELYVGHDNGGISILNFSTGEWYFEAPITQLGAGSVKCLATNFRTVSGAKTIFAGNTANSRIVKVNVETFDCDYAPGYGDFTDVLLSVPGSKVSIDGNYFVDQKQYPINQPFWFVFSKPVDSNTISNFLTLSSSIDGSGSNINLQVVQFGDYSVAAYPVNSSNAQIDLAHASGYNLKLSMGATAVDNSFITSGLNVGFYTEDIVPVLGWEKLGKMLVLSGSDNHLIEGIYLRNPQSTDITIIALIGN
jgi:hypothetical protein